ncbi:uncharacterized protein LOC128171648 isoform X2 [Crassostrea angulata]|uniref:uncharacterized protein LOC128171648 isoform X2 n=1 Tax=Magallana angulata TaxID=2784310 RepID=UPI0022B16FD3|nr:uncharacterized protein LOC128171648 isoform X2 [Crassostrea angulata]
MDQSYQLYIFILSTTILFTDIKPTGNFSHNWFDAQDHCLGQGLTIDKDKSIQPYWTGVFRRLTPWINILGCYSDSVELIPTVVKKTMMISSVGMCQELCYHENSYKFAIKTNNCLCMQSDLNLNSFDKLSPSACNLTCEDNTDIVYAGDCGGENAYNLFEFKEVSFNSVERCMSLQCSKEDIRFIPQTCSSSFYKVCENMNLTDNGYASSWIISMDQCKKSHPPNYLLGNVVFNNPRLTCTLLNYQFPIVWIGVARQIYTSFDQGLEVKREQRGTFVECQMCTNNDCLFRPCFDQLRGSIFCQSISNTSLSRTTEYVTTSQGRFSASTFIPNSSVSKTGNYDRDLFSVTSESGDELVFKITLPLTLGLIVLLLCLVGVVLYKRSKMTKTDRTKKADVKFVSKKKVYSELDFSEGNPSFALEHCYQKISKGSNSLNESPCSKQDGVNDYQRDRHTERNIIYQNASANITGDTSGYDTIAYSKNQEEEATYDHLRQNANET